MKDLTIFDSTIDLKIYPFTGDQDQLRAWVPAGRSFDAGCLIIEEWGALLDGRGQMILGGVYRFRTTDRSLH